MSTGDDLDLSEAYAVETPDDNRDLYARWASTYESGFIARHEYVYHQGVAAVFAEAAGPDDVPVLDVGCGTGLVGVALRALGVDAIDGLDLSPEMLDEARTKVDGDGSPPVLKYDAEWIAVLKSTAPLFSTRRGAVPLGADAI